jgi:nitrous oxidase accessory protein
MKWLAMSMVVCYNYMAFAGVKQILPTLDSTQIKEIIQSADPFDTLLFIEGHYFIHDIIIDKPLTILGKGNVLVDGESKYEIIVISAKNVHISNIAFINSGYSSLNDFAAIKLIDASEVIISNNRIKNAFFAIHISNSTQIQIQQNTIEGNANSEQLNGNAIHAWKCHHLLIEKNILSRHRDGIYLEFVSHSIIRENSSFMQMRYGLHFMFSNDDLYENNQFSNNGAGVAVMYSKNVKMAKNTFLQNIGASAYGLLLKDITDSEINHNSFLQNTKGIEMEGSNRIKIEQNIFEDNGWGIAIQASCMDNTITNNNFINNGFDVSTNGKVILNKFDKNYWDRYSGYDLKKDGIGDVPHRPLSLMSTLMEQHQGILILMNSFIIHLFDKLERILPTLTPEDFIDLNPSMHAYPIH